MTRYQEMIVKYLEAEYRMPADNIIRAESEERMLTDPVMKVC